MDLKVPPYKKQTSSKLKRYLCPKIDLIFGQMKILTLIYAHLYNVPDIYFLWRPKVPPSGERRGQRTERHVISKATEGYTRTSFRRLANHMPFSSLTATLSTRWDFTNLWSEFQTWFSNWMILKSCLVCFKDSKKPPHMEAPESWGWLFPQCTV